MSRANIRDVAARAGVAVKTVSRVLNGHPYVSAELKARVEAAMVEYMARQVREHGTPWTAIARHMIGLYNGVPGARRWRQVWSDHRLKAQAPADVSRWARGALEAIPA